MRPDPWEKSTNDDFSPRSPSIRREKSPLVDFSGRTGPRQAVSPQTEPRNDSGRALIGPGRHKRLALQLLVASSDMMVRISSAVSLGVLPTLTPAASRASCFAAAVPEEPETIAPAWPIVFPSGAVNPAM